MVVDKFDLRFWNGFYYCAVQLPDGAKQELKSDTDLTYGQWQEKITSAWDASQIPEPPAECLCSQCKVGEKECPRLKVTLIKE